MRLLPRRNKDDEWEVVYEPKGTPPKNPVYDETDLGPTLYRKINTLRWDLSVCHWLLKPFRAVDSAMDFIADALIKDAMAKLPDPKPDDYTMPTTTIATFIDLASSPITAHTSFRHAATKGFEKLGIRRFGEEQLDDVALLFLFWNAAYLPAVARPKWSAKLTAEWLDHDRELTIVWFEKAYKLGNKMMRTWGTREESSTFLPKSRVLGVYAPPISTLSASPINVRASVIPNNAPIPPPATSRTATPASADSDSDDDAVEDGGSGYVPSGSVQVNEVRSPSNNVVTFRPRPVDNTNATGSESLVNSDSDDDDDEDGVRGQSGSWY